MPAPKEIPVPGLRTLRRVVHLADVHIRAGDRQQSREDEYAAAFRALGDALAPYRGADDTIAVVCGDIFHHKCRIEAHGLRLFGAFLDAVTRNVPVVLISGNHDFRQSDADPAAPDMVAAVLGARGAAGDVVHLTETGLYRIGGATFGLVAARDTLDIGAGAGMRAPDELPPFPQPPDGADGPRIALFHGTIAGARTASISLGGVPAAWFGGGYDLALLGDIHHQQVVTEPSGLRWAYPGSLVQQGFGESVDGHGFLVWDLATRDVEAVELPSAWGFVTAERGPGGDWISVPDGTPLDVVRDLRPHARVRAIAADLDEVPPGATPIFAPPAAPEAVGERMAAADWDAFVAETASEEQRERLALLGDGPAADLLGPDVLAVPPRDAGACGADKLAARNDKIAALALAAEDAAGTRPRGTVRVTALEWSWILCYGEANQLALPETGLTMITGANGVGKTSVFEVLCLALFGESPASRGGKDTGATILCNAKPRGKGARTAVRFSCAAGDFHLARLFEARSDDPQRLKAQTVTLSAVGACGRLTREVTGKSAVAAWLRDVAGVDGLDAWLAGCMITQAQERDFFSLPPADQIAVLEAAVPAKGAHAEAVAESVRAHKWALGQTEAVEDALARADRTAEIAELRAAVAAAEEAVLAAREEARAAEAAFAVAFPGTANVPGPAAVARAEAAVAAAGDEDPEEDVPEETLAAAVSEYDARPAYADLRDARDVEMDLAGAVAELARAPGIPPGAKYHGKTRAAARLWEQRLLRPHGGSLARAEAEAARHRELLVADRDAREREAALRKALSSAVRPTSPVASGARERDARRAAARAPAPEAVAAARDRIRLAELLGGSLAGVLPNPGCEACMSRGDTAAAAVALAESLRARGEPTEDPGDDRATLRAAEERARLEETAEADARTLEELEAWEAGGGDAAARALREAEVAVQQTSAALVQSHAASHAVAELREHAQFVRRDLAAQMVWDALERVRARGIDAETLRLAQHASVVRAVQRTQTELRGADGRLSEARGALERALARSSDPVELARVRRDAAALRARTAALGTLAELLGGFRAWLLRRVVVPDLARRVNAMVSAAFPAAALLSAEVSPAGDRVRFLAGGAAVQKASGFQRWSLGLAVRVALAGLAGAPPPQLFVDEGFGVCDARHLEMVPAFLRALAPSVLAVSHLEEVRVAADRSVRVERDPATRVSAIV